MNARDRFRPVFQTVVACIAVMTTAATLSAEPPKADRSPPSKEMREKMATLHEQMAACLRSEKPISECHTEMAKNCREAMGEQGCPMMDHGMRPRHKMEAPSKDSQSPDRK